MRFISPRNVSADIKDKKRAPDVIACGLPRCATSSLQAALEHLGFKPCMHMSEVAPYPWKLKLVRRAMELLHPDKRESFKAERQAILHRLFDGWAASSDFPGCMFVEDLMEMYPQAKIILNTREANAWSRSGNDTLMKMNSPWFFLAGYWDPGVNGLKNLFREWESLGPGLYGAEAIFDPRVADAHIKRVRKAAANHGREVLEWEVSMGWKPICDFLDVQVPNVPFPHVNDTNTVKMIVAILYTRGILRWAAIPGVPLLSYWIYKRFLTARFS